MITGDGAYIKKINRGLILSKIIEHEAISRAELSKITGLNKATISVQVADLLEKEIIYETKVDHHVVGRRPIMLSINREVGYVLGIDFDYKYIHYTISDMGGHPVHSHTTECETDLYVQIVPLLVKQIKAYQKQWAPHGLGLISVIIGIHGTVNKDEKINFIPTYQWHDKDLKADLAKEVDIKINIENSANLATYAERVYKHHYSNHLLAITLSSGIGAGIMIDGKLHQGYHGFAGEMGHMIILPNGKHCRCGNKGCWELYAAEPILLKQVAEKRQEPNMTIDEVKPLIAEQDPSITPFLSQFIKHLSIGLNNIINLYNPETLVINSDILASYPAALSEIKKNLVSTVSQYRQLIISDLGKKACIMGACALAIQQFLEVPELIFTTPSKDTK